MLNQSLLASINEVFCESQWFVPPISSTATDPEKAEANTKAAHSWTDLRSSGILTDLRWTIDIIDDQLFVYLLPGFMIESLSDSTGMWIDVINRMAPPWKRGERPVFCRGIEYLASNQRDVVAAYIEQIIASKYPKDNIRRRLNLIKSELSAT